MNGCPSAEQLQHWLNQEAHAAAQSDLALHIDTCVACQGVLDGYLRETFPQVSGYEVLAEVGRGAVGIVYKARHLVLNRLVALKMIRGDAPPEALRRFRSEAEAVARLQHPNVVRIFEVGEHHGLPYFSMEFCPGGSLKGRLSNNPLDPREAAEVVQTLAFAVEAAHRAGIIHRDLKPANILIGADGLLKVADFGLAKLLDGSSDQTQTGWVLGTPSYMAPEQADGRTRDLDAWTDVYALGAVLYECLTGRPPFRAPTGSETCRQVIQQEPVRVRQLQPKVPRDLETVCLKCLQKNPKDRYLASGQLAEDLGRFLDDKPVRARPVSAPERVWRWCRRRPALAALLGVLAIFLGVVAFGVILFIMFQRSHARELERELTVQQLQADLVESPPPAGWFVPLWQKVHRAASSKDDRLRTLAITALAGFDAHRGPRLDAPVAGVVFDPSGERMLLGGTSDGPALLWNPKTGARVESGKRGNGPVAFRKPDGAPLQMLARPGPAVVLWNMGTEGELASAGFGLPPGLEWSFPLNANGQEVMALSDDGTLMAAAVVSDSAGYAAVWETTSGRRLAQVPVRATALAILPGDEPWLAVGEATGRISLHPIGREGPAPVLLLEGPPVRCLACRDPSTLAAGDAGGKVTVWERRGDSWEHLAACRGAPYGVHAVAFSPDHATLACGGRYFVQLWDIATSRPLLLVGCGDRITGLAFGSSAAPGRLAVTAAGNEPRHQNVQLWDLEPGRGVTMLRGLSARVSLTCLSPSPDGTTRSRYLAALSHDRQVGLWELENHRLLWIRRVPSVLSPDNGAFAFSADGQRLAFQAGERAVLWDIPSGRELGSWPLPWGLCDCLLFDAGGRLLSFRAEADDGGKPVFGRRPCVCQLRELSLGKPPVQMKTSGNLNREVLCARPVRGSDCFIAEGTSGWPAAAETWVMAFRADGDAWKRRLEGEIPPYATLAFDALGQVVAVWDPDSKKALLLDAGTGDVRQRIEGTTGTALSPDLRSAVRVTVGPDGFARGLLLFRTGQPDSGLATFLFRASPSSDATFDTTGELLVWGNNDGSVTLCDLPKVRARLRACGLDWDD